MKSYWIGYDLSDDRERARIERALKRFGLRIQKSVFYCELNDDQLKTLHSALERISPVSGHIAITPVPAARQWTIIGRQPDYLDLLDSQTVCLL